KNIGYLSTQNGAGRGNNGLTDAERQYANGFLIKYSASYYPNGAPPQTISSSDDLKTGGDFRVYQRLQAYYEINPVANTINPSSVRYLHKGTINGLTPEPCTWIRFKAMSEA